MLLGNGVKSFLGQSPTHGGQMALMTHPQSSTEIILKGVAWFSVEEKLPLSEIPEYLLFYILALPCQGESKSSSSG